MELIEELANAIISGESLLASSIAQELGRKRPSLVSIPPPQTDDPRLVAIAAALLELFAVRWGQSSPDWTRSIGALDEPIYLVKAAMTIKNLRTLCETEAPEPLRKRRLYAPPNYLEFA